MKHVLIIGSGLSGLTCALRLAESGIRATLVSPYPSERAQSVMAAGDAAITTHLFLKKMGRLRLRSLRNMWT